MTPTLHAERAAACRASHAAVVLVALALVAGPAQSRAQQYASSLPSDFDRYVASVLAEFRVPGVSVAVVKDGRVILAKGYGVRALGESAPVDSRTQFGIASNTKAFTATALGILVDEGKLEWDAPVIRYLPSFAMYDPYVTRELTVRDLLVHRSGLGLGAGDLLWWPPTTHDRQEIMRRIRFIRPETSFRSAYAYDNVLYLVAGAVTETVSGQSWEDFISSRILAPVGMSHSSVLHSAAGAGEEVNVARTHAEVEGTVRRIAPFLSDNTNPAGGVNSGAEDMAKWMIVQLDSGRLRSGGRLFSQRTARELWTPVTPIPIGSVPAELGFLRANFSGYALGFSARDYRGWKMLTHTGGLPGYVSRVAMIPDQKIGVAVLTNQESGFAFNAIVHRVLDHLLGAPRVDYVAIYRNLEARQRASMDSVEHAAAASRDTASRPSLPLARYAGTYADAWYGTVTLSLTGDGLAIRFEHTPLLVGDLEHWQHDTFIARWRDRELRADAYVSFALNPDGSIDQMKMRAVSPATDFSFDFHDLLFKPARQAAR